MLLRKVFRIPFQRCNVWLMKSWIPYKPNPSITLLLKIPSEYSALTIDDKHLTGRCRQTLMKTTTVRFSTQHCTDWWVVLIRPPEHELCIAYTWVWRGKSPGNKPRPDLARRTNDDDGVILETNRLCRQSNYLSMWNLQPRWMINFRMFDRGPDSNGVGGKRLRHNGHVINGPIRFREVKRPPGSMQRK